MKVKLFSEHASVIVSCFKAWCEYRNLSLDSEDLSEDDIRCAIVSYSLYVRRQLLDIYDVDIKEGE